MEKLLITFLFIAFVKDALSNTTANTNDIEDDVIPTTSLANKYTIMRQTIIIIVIFVVMITLNAVLYKFTFEMLKTPDSTTTTAAQPRNPSNPSALAESQSRKSDGASTK